ncbi:hypothetical protein EYF80_024700 [Liparis tanakae]|uniref:Uncharacterized protein n=1 Tax=Liparis tanakae TaxID=230148 RepID=A0A4Z2HHK4_9TELE|nr:hypothetical protein EYF80_024700 [Liparis tanakae]
MEFGFRPPPPPAAAARTRTSSSVEFGQSPIGVSTNSWAVPAAPTFLTSPCSDSRCSRLQRLLLVP